MGLLSRGDDQLARREQAAEADFERSVHQRNLDRADQGDLQQEHFEELIEAGIPSGTVHMLSDLLSQDFVLANMGSAEVNENRWLARNLALRLFAAHPSQDSVLTGEWRTFVLDEPDQALKPLTDGQRARIFTFIMNYLARNSRSKDGWQQEEIGKQYRVSETITDEKRDTGGWFSR